MVVGYGGDLCLFGFAVLVWFLGGLAGFCYCGCGMDSTWLLLFCGLWRFGLAFGTVALVAW